MPYYNNDTWEVEPVKEADDCSYCDNSMAGKPQFVLTPELLAVIRTLCTTIQREWQILLKGNVTDNGIYCYDYVIPKQETTLATVYNDDDIDTKFVEDNSIVATCHSHNDMAVGFSHTDEVCTNNSMIKNHIVTNNKGDFKAISRIELPCGLNKFVDAIVMSEAPAIEAKDIKGLENIKERTSPITYHQGSNENITWKRGNKRNHAFGYDQGPNGYGRYGYGY